MKEEEGVGWKKSVKGMGLKKGDGIRIERRRKGVCLKEGKGMWLKEGEGSWR